MQSTVKFWQIRARTLSGTEERITPLWLLHSSVSPLPFQIDTTTPRLQLVGMIPVLQIEHKRVSNHRRAAAPPALSISA